MIFHGRKNEKTSNMEHDLKQTSDGVGAKAAKKTEREASPKASVSQKRTSRAAFVSQRSKSSHSVPKKERVVPENLKPFYDKLLRLQTLLTEWNVAPEEGDEELLEFVTDRSQVLSEVRAAIERIFNGTYGICEFTHKPIAPGRLEVMPYTRYSTEGQQQMEALRTDRFSSDGDVPEENDEEERDEDDRLPYASDDETDE